MKINEGHLRRLKEARTSQARKKEEEQIMDELERLPANKNPFGKQGDEWVKLTDDQIDDYMDELDRRMKIIAKPEDVQEAQSIEDLNELLNDYFKYAHKPITIDMLRSIKGMNQASILIQNDAYKQKGFASAFADVVKRYKDSNETTTNEVNNLKALTTKLRAGFKKKGTRVKRAKPTRRKYKIKDVLGKPDIKDLEKRDRIYSYWEGVDKKYKKVQSTLKSLLKHGNAANYEDSMQKKLDKLESVSKVGSLEYVVKVEPQGLVLTPSDIRAFELVKQYLIVRGLDEKEETGEIRGKGQGEQQAERAKITSREDAREKLREDRYNKEGKFKDIIEGESEEEMAYGTVDATPEMADPKGRELTQAEEASLEYAEAVGWLEEIETKSVLVDPLMNYYFQENDTFVPITAGELKTIKRELDALQLGDAFANPEQAEEFDDWVEELSSNVEVYENDRFFLPYTETIKDLKTVPKEGDESFIPDDDAEDMLDASKNIAEFLGAIAELIEGYETQFPYYQTQGNKAVTGVSLPDKPTQQSPAMEVASRVQAALFPKLALPGIKGEKDVKFIEDDKFNDKLYNLLKAVSEYYIVPLRTQYFYDDKLPRWVSDHSTAEASIDRINLYAENDFTEMIERFVEDGTARFSASGFKSLSIFLQNITGSTVQLDDSVKSTAKIAANALMQMLGERNEKMIKAWIGASLYNMINDKDRSQESWTFFGKSLSRHWDAYKKLTASGKPNPILMISLFLNKYSNEIEADPTIEKEVKDFIRVVNKLNKRSKVEIQLMDAHDAIRIMKGLPVYYGRYYLNDPDSMDEVITKMEAKHKVDLAAAEVYDIVKTVDAIKNIANNHGLSDELVYELKANFR
jgi:hypothetical protein